MSTSERRGPLVGLKVIDLATVVAGPGVAKYFADYGADVIKVEAPEGDSTRRTGPGRSAATRRGER